MKKIALILIVYLSVCCITIAQTDFRKGYVLLTQSDTLFGKIGNKDYYQNSRFCDFIGQNSKDVVRYLPCQIYGYRFDNGKYYIAKTITTDSNQVSLFLEYLINGKLNIFYSQDKGFSPHFYASKDTISIRELKYSQGIKQFDGKQMFYEGRQYAGVLSYLTSDCPQIASDIQKLEQPDQKNLIKIAGKYHSLVCPDQRCEVYNKKIPSKIRIGSHYAVNRFFGMITDDLLNNLKGEFYSQVGIDFYLQQAQRLENIYLGIGYRKVIEDDPDNNYFLIPLSINYFSSKDGISPLFSYEFELNYLFLQTIKTGIQYKIKRINLSLYGELDTMLFVFPYGAALNCGISFDLRK